MILYHPHLQDLNGLDSHDCLPAPMTPTSSSPVITVRSTGSSPSNDNNSKSGRTVTVTIDFSASSNPNQPQSTSSNAVASSSLAADKSESIITNTSVSFPSPVSSSSQVLSPSGSLPQDSSSVNRDTSIPSSPPASAEVQRLLSQSSSSSSSSATAMLKASLGVASASRSRTGKTSNRKARKNPNRKPSLNVWQNLEVYCRSTFILDSAVNDYLIVIIKWADLLLSFVLQSALASGEIIPKRQISDELILDQQLVWHQEFSLIRIE